MDEFSDLTFIYCNTQTEGRGRLDRKWVSSNPNNIYLTIVLKPQEENYPFINVTQYLCVIVSKVLENYGAEAKIKWPNDILVNGKKIAGILAQTASIGSKFKGIALGIGINLNSDKAEIDSIDRPAASLNLEIGRNINRDAFLNELAEEFERNYEKFKKEGFRYIEQDYLKRANFLNEEITVSTAEKSLRGIVKNLTEDGALVLCEENKEVVITMGEIL